MHSYRRTPHRTISHRRGAWLSPWVVLAATVAFGLIGCGGAGSPPVVPQPEAPPPPPPNQAPSLSAEPTLTFGGPGGTNQLDIGGGDVTIKAAVTDPDGDAVTVTAVVVDDTGSATEITLTDTGGGVFQGTFSAPPNINPNGQSAVYNVTLRVVDSKGNELVKPLGQFIVPAPNGPPGPPGTQL